MSDFLSAFGKIFIFCTFLPGLTGLILIAIIFPDAKIAEINPWYVMMGLVYAVGFVANACGHALQVRLNPKKDGIRIDRYGENILRIGDKHPDGENWLRDFYEYSECIHIWYWNSATIIPLIVIVWGVRYFAKKLEWNCTQLCAELLWALLAIVVCVLLFYVVRKLRKWWDRRFPVPVE